ncbi:MAG: hypothetical protein OHK0046_08610 [Anaerolineae bacterium]
MKMLLEKLDKMSERWLNTLDRQLEQPLLHVITGRVFTDANSHMDMLVTQAAVNVVETLCEPAQPAYAKNTGEKKTVRERTTQTAPMMGIYPAADEC